MEAIQELFNINFSYVFISVFIILTGIKSITSIFEWIIDKFGLETRRGRKQREEHELLIQTSQRLAALQKQQLEYNSNKDKQIDNLMVAQREVLADRINEKYKYYISIKGIPEDEVDEFTNLTRCATLISDY